MARKFLLLMVLIFVSFVACTLPSPQPTPTPTPANVTVNVYFTYLPNFNVGTEPYEKAVTRQVSASIPAPEAVLTELFKGPTAEEKAQGLDVFTSGATGFSKLTIDAGVARVYLTGQCASNGATYTIANLISANLKQFPEIKWIKIYDPNGETETPEGDSGSIPFCLEP